MLTGRLARLLLTLGLVGALGGACAQAGPPSSAQQATPPSSTPPGSPAPGGGSPSLDRCHTPQLSLAPIGPVNAGAGNFYQEFGLTNRSGAPCWFYGYVGMQMLDANGQPLPTNVVRDTGGRFPWAHVSQFTVPDGAVSPFWIHWGGAPVGAETSCPTSASLLVTPPDEFTQLRLDGYSIRACGQGELDVSPMTPPGTTGP